MKFSQFVLHALIFWKSENISKVQLAAVYSLGFITMLSFQARAGIFCNIIKRNWKKKKTKQQQNNPKLQVWHHIHTDFFLPRMKLFIISSHYLEVQHLHLRSFRALEQLSEHCYLSVFPQTQLLQRVMAGPLLLLLLPEQPQGFVEPTANLLKT